MRLYPRRVYVFVGDEDCPTPVVAWGMEAQARAEAAVPALALTGATMACGADVAGPDLAAVYGVGAAGVAGLGIALDAPLTAQVVATLSAIGAAFAGPSVGANAALPGLAAIYGAAAAGVVGLGLGMDASLTIAAAARVSAMGAAFLGPSVGVMANLATLRAEYPALTASALASLPIAMLQHTRLCGCDVVELEYQTSAMLATKDTWAPIGAPCLDDAIKNGSNLTVDSVPRDAAFMAWNLSGFPTGATVTDATLQLHLVTPPTTASATGLDRLNDADEGWLETTLRCSTAPPTAGNLQTANFGSTAGEKLVVLGANWRSRIQARMGIGPVTIRLEQGTGNIGASVYQSKDSGGSPGNASGPRLALRFTVPV